MMSISVVKKSDGSTFSDQHSRQNVMDVFVPGEIISANLGDYMRGHGTHTISQISSSHSAMEITLNEEEKKDTKEETMEATKPAAAVEGTKAPTSELRASLGGRLRRVNKLLTVESPRFRYVGHVGDCIVGRVVAVGQRRWLVDTNSRLLSILLLSSVNLPGGEQRRKSEEDERTMRAWLREGDVVSAEVQSIYHDGSLALHTRSLRYGKVGSPPSEGGVLLTVPPALVRRAKTHFHTLPCGTSVIIGNNGMVWVEPPPVKKRGEDSDGVMLTDSSNIDSLVVTREAAARVRNCILSLATGGLPLYASSIVAAVEISTARCSSASELLVSSIAQEITESVAGKLAAGVI